MKTKGFTLVETILTLALLSIVFCIGIAAMYSGIDTWGFFTQRKEILADGRMAMDRMCRQIRMIRNDTSVTTANSTTFRFTDGNNNDIMFTISAAAINLTQNGTTNALVSGVNSLTFTYYDANGSVIATPVVAPSATNIRRLRIAVSLSKGTSGTFNMQSDVWPRNL